MNVLLNTVCLFGELASVLHVPPVFLSGMVKPYMYLPSLHLMKMSQERCEATVKMLEMDKGRLAKRCDELEQEVASLQKAHDLAQNTRHTALEERTKASLCAFHV